MLFRSKFAEENFGKEKGKVPKISFGLKNKSLIEKRKGISQANFVFAYHTPLEGDEKTYSALILNEAMAWGMSSILFREIREKRNLAYSVNGSSNINKEFAYNLIYVGAKKENIKKIKKIILEEFKKFSESFDEKKLLKIKNQLIGRFYLSKIGRASCRERV